jgi:hypothetical protein
VQLTKNFSLEELTASSTALRLGIDNAPSAEIVGNLLVTAVGLENARVILGEMPLHIDSGYRCPALNAAVGGAKDSAHMTGFAADVVCAFEPIVVIRKLLLGSLEFDQLIQEGAWTHMSFAPTMRKQVLTAHFGPGGTTYTEGL